MDRQLEGLFDRYRKTGDPDALARVFDATAPEVYRAARRRVADAAEAEDLVQATFLSVIEAAPRFEGGRRLMPWLIGILHIHILRRARLRRRDAIPPPVTETPSADPAAVAARREMAAAAVRALDRLPQPYRRVVELSLRRGLPPADIGRVVGRSPSTVRTQLQRGLSMLRKMLPFSLVFGLFVRRADGATRVRPAVALAAPLAATVLFLVMAADPSRAVTHAARTEPHIDVAPAALPRAGSASSSSPVVPPTIAPAPVRRARAGLRVEVRLTDGRPAPHVGVRVESLDGPHSGHNARYGITDAAGVVSFDALHPGAQRVFADRGVDERVTVAAGATATLRLDLAAGRTVRGIVRDDAGRPVPGARIRLVEYAGQVAGPPVVRTGPQGRFALHAVSERALLCASAPGAGPSEAVRATADVELTLGWPGARLHGVVRGPDGAPIADAVVTVGAHVTPAMLRENPFARPPFRLRTDAAGRFDATGLAPGPRRVVARIDGLVTWTEIVHLDAGRAQALDVTLRRGTVVTGSIRRPDGAPAPGVALEFPGCGFHTPYYVLTRADGTFRAEGLPAGRLRYRVFGGAHGRAEGWAESATLDIETTIADRIACTLVDDTGQPCVGLHVHLAGTIHRAVTDRAGRFEFAGCAPRWHELVVHDDDGRRLMLRCSARVEPSHGTRVIHVATR